MAIDKNKRLSKGGKRSTKRKVGDSMLQKEWYDIVAPATFTARHCGKTVVNKSKGTFSGPESLKGRVFELCLADLMNNNEDKIYKARNMKLKAEDVHGRNVLTNFHGMSLTTDTLRSLVKKWVTLIEGSVEAKTSDGYTLRVFAIAFTTTMPSQVKKNCHCQTSHVKKIRQKMSEIITKAITKNTLEKVVKNLQQDIMGDEIKKACHGIFPVATANIRKVKVCKAPKTDLARLVEAHGGQEKIPKSVEGGRQLKQEVVEETTEVEADD